MINETKRNELLTFASDSSGQLDILWHDGHALGMDSSQVGAFEEANEVNLGI